MSVAPYPEIVSCITEQVNVLNKEIPETMKGFWAMLEGAEKPGALDKKTKELIAMGIDIALRCDGCIGFHSNNLVKLGVTRAEYEEMLGVSIFMGGGPSLMYAAQALSAWEEFGGEKS